MWADLEPLAGVIRVFSDDAKYGEPYEWSATVRCLDPRTVEILGIMRAPKPSEWRAIIQLFSTGGMEKIVFHRRKNGKSITRELTLRKKG